MIALLRRGKSTGWPSRESSPPKGRGLPRGTSEELIHIAGVTPMRRAPYYLQSNGEACKATQRYWIGHAGRRAG